MQEVAERDIIRLRLDMLNYSFPERITDLIRIYEIFDLMEKSRVEIDNNDVLHVKVHRSELPEIMGQLERSFCGNHDSSSGSSKKTKAN